MWEEIFVLEEKLFTEKIKFIAPLCSVWGGYASSFDVLFYSCFKEECTK